MATPILLTRKLDATAQGRGIQLLYLTHRCSTNMKTPRDKPVVSAFWEVTRSLTVTTRRTYILCPEQILNYTGQISVSSSILTRTMQSKFELDYLTCASRLVESLYGEAQLEIAEAIALQYVEAGQLERGVEQAEQLPDAYARDSLLAVITAKALASERESDAIEILDTIEDPIVQNSAIEQMSIEYARSGKFDSALSFADQLSDNASALSFIAIALWQRGQKNDAIDLARSIEPAQQSATLVQLARLSDDEEESLSLLAEARDVAEEIEAAEIKTIALIEIASGYEQRADREHAIETLDQAFEVGEDFESVSLVGLSGDFARDEVLLEILDGFVKVQELDKANEVAEVIEDRFLFARANLKLAVAREAGEDLDEAMAIIGKLEAYSPQEVDVRDNVIVELATAYANRKDYAQARRLISSVISKEKRLLALKDFGKLSDTEAHEIERDLGSPYDKAHYWLGIYDATSASQTDFSEQALAQALASAESLGQPVEKAEAFTEVALRLAKSQRSEQAENYFLAATKAVTNIDGNYLKARALLRLAKASQEAGRKPNQNERPLLDEIIAHVG